MEHLRPEHLWHITIMVFAVFVVLVLLPTYWTEVTEVVRGLFLRYVQVLRNGAHVDEPEESTQNDHETTRNETNETAKHGAATPDTGQNELFLFLAKFVSAGVITETDGLRIGFGVSPGSSRKYREARSSLRAALAELQGGPRYQPLDENSQPVQGGK